MGQDHSSLSKDIAKSDVHHLKTAIAQDASTKNEASPQNAVHPEVTSNTDNNTKDSAEVVRDENKADVEENTKKIVIPDSPSLQKVIKKVEGNKNFKAMHGKPDFIKAFAFCLSDKERLKETYLNTDWAVNKLWRRNKLAQKKLTEQLAALLSGNENCSEDDKDQSVVVVEDDEEEADRKTKKLNLKSVMSMTKSKSESNGHVEDLDEHNDEEDDEDEEMRELWLLENPKLEKNLKVKLIITDMNAESEMRQNLRSTVSPVLSKLKFLPKYGIFHTCLVVGPFKLEWTNSALCIPRVIKSKASLVALDIKEIATIGEFKTTIDLIADVIVRWNCRMGYSETHSTKKKGNCQDFVIEMLEALNIPLNLSGPVDTYLKEMKKFGQCKMKFTMDDHFLKHFHMQESSIVFETHKQLDEFTRQCLYSDPHFGKTSFVSEFELLKGFDRAFWMRHLEQISRDESKLDPNHAAFKPLTEISEKIIDLETFEEKVQERCMCPFDDPRLTISFLDKSSDGGNK